MDSEEPRSARRRTRRESQFPRLDKAIRELTGAHLKRASWSYGDELVLDFSASGRSSPRDGRYSIRTRASRWVLLSKGAIEAHDRDEKDPALAAFNPLRGARVEAINARRADYALMAAFTNGYRFLILTNKPRAGRMPELALWELFAPREVVYVQPNGYVDIVPGELTEEEAYRRGLLHARLD